MKFAVEDLKIFRRHTKVWRRKFSNPKQEVRQIWKFLEWIACATDFEV